MNKKKYTIMILPDETTRVRKYRVPRTMVRGLLVILAIVTLGLGYLVTDYYSVKKMVAELDRRLQAAGSPVTAYACHPGYSATALQSTGPEGVLNMLYKVLNPLVAQPAYNGAIPTVLAAAGEEALPGRYYGPRKFGEARGPVGDARVSRAARNEKVAARLWEESEQLVGFQWDFDTA